MAAGEVDGHGATGVAEQQVRLGEQSALAEQLARAAQDHEHGAEADAGGQSVQERPWQRVARRKGLCAADDGAVGDDQRDEDAEHAVQVVEERAEQQFRRRHQGCDDDHEYGDANFRAQQVPDRRHDAVGQHQHEGGGQTQTEPVDDARGHGQQRAQPQQLNQTRVVAPQPVGGDIPVAGAHDSSSAVGPAESANSASRLALKYIKAL